MKWYWVYWKPEWATKYEKYAPATNIEKARLIALQLDLFGFEYMIVEE